MVRKCKTCGTKIIHFPLWKGQEHDEPFSKDKIIWINWFKMDMMSVAFLVIVVALIIGFQNDTAKCNQVIEDPCGFCTNAAEVCGYSGIDQQVRDTVNPDWIDYELDLPT